MTYIACGVTALAGYAAGEVSPASEELTEKWGISAVVYNLSITLFCCGFALAPMVLAPFSEINGRRPIFIASGILFVGMCAILRYVLGLTDGSRQLAWSVVEEHNHLLGCLSLDSSKVLVDVCIFNN